MPCTIIVVSSSNLLILRAYLLNSIVVLKFTKERRCLSFYSTNKEHFMLSASISMIGQEVTLAYVSFDSIFVLGNILGIVTNLMVVFVLGLLDFDMRREH